MCRFAVKPRLPLRPRTGSKPRPGNMVATGPDAVAELVARTGNRKEIRTESGVSQRTRTDDTCWPPRPRTGLAAASDTNVATVAVRLPGRRCACASVGAVHRTCRIVCRNTTTAFRRPSTNTRTAVGWRPRPGRPIGRARTPRPLCGDGVAVVAVVVDGGGGAADAGGDELRQTRVGVGVDWRRVSSWDSRPCIEYSRPDRERRILVTVAIVYPRPNGRPIDTRHSMDPDTVTTAVGARRLV